MVLFLADVLFDMRHTLLASGMYGNQDALVSSKMLYLIIILSLCWIDIGVADDDFWQDEILDNNLVINGKMFVEDTEVMTPEGIVDENDFRQNFDDIMPAAGANKDDFLVFDGAENQ